MSRLMPSRPRSERSDGSSCCVVMAYRVLPDASPIRFIHPTMG
jgi:hypothetical protein